MPFYTTCPKTDMPFNTIALKQTWLFADMTFYTTAQLQFSLLEHLKGVKDFEYEYKSLCHDELDRLIWPL